jgi:hypothetical protein
MCIYLAIFGDIECMKVKHLKHLFIIVSNLWRFFGVNFGEFFGSFCFLNFKKEFEKIIFFFHSKYVFAKWWKIRHKILFKKKKSFPPTKIRG